MCSATALLYITASCVLLCLGSAEDVEHEEGHLRSTYPDPTFNFFRCGRTQISYICDPDTIISKDEGYLVTV